MVHKLGECYLAWHKQATKLPKPDRFTLGVRVENLMLDLIELILLAKSKTATSQLLILNKADLKLQTLKLMVRIAHEARALSDIAYAKHEERLLEIGCLVGGWLKQIQNKEVGKTPLF